MAMKKNKPAPRKRDAIFVQADEALRERLDQLLKDHTQRNPGMRVTQADVIRSTIHKSKTPTMIYETLITRARHDLDGDKLPDSAWTLIRYCVESLVIGSRELVDTTIKMFPTHIDEEGKEHQLPASEIAAAVAWSRDEDNVWTLLTTVNTLKFLHVQELGV